MQSINHEACPVKRVSDIELKGCMGPALISAVVLIHRHTFKSETNSGTFEILFYFLRI